MAWKCAYDMLGKVDNKSPTKINHENQIITNPKALASAFNKIFREKVDKLREKTTTEPKVEETSSIQLLRKHDSLVQILPGGQNTSCPS